MKVDGISQNTIALIEKGHYTREEFQEWIVFADKKVDMWKQFRDLCWIMFYEVK